MQSSQAPDSPATKRKRGRPANASRPAADDASHADDTLTGASRDNGIADADDERPRKRGKTATEQHNEPAVTAAAQPRKRGRPRKSTDMAPDAQQQQQQPDKEDLHAAPARRGRPRKDDAGARRDEALAAEEEAAPRKKRGQPSLQRAEDVEGSSREQPELEPSDQAPPKRKRGRPSLQKPPEADEQPEEQQEDDEASRETQRRKRGRRSPKPPEAEQADDADATQSQRGQQAASKPRKRGRPSLQGISPAQAQNKAPKARRRKPQKPRRDEVDEEEAEAPETQTQPDRRRKRKSATEQPIGRKGVPKPDQPGSRTEGRKRRRSSQGDPDQQQTRDDNGPPSPSKPYARIVPRVRRVRQATITAKWAPLSGPSLPAVSTLLHLAHRPILQRLSNTHQRREHTSAALRLITHRIARKVTRGLPFPPASMPPTSSSSSSSSSSSKSSAAASSGARRQTQRAAVADGGRETELNFESVLDGKAALERQLEPAAHAVELLRREKEHVEQELERDYEMLRTLEAGARAQAREQRSLLKKAHPLVPEAPKLEPHHDDDADSRVFTKSRDQGPDAPVGVFTDNNNLSQDQDEALRPLVAQLGGHVESMRANLAQADGVVAQLERSRGALLAALMRHLGAEQYERVVLG
ncbi:kinetochore protein fta7 [Purpureocillium lilacinum]|uniref:Kinetochore protein fta7 n=1 Tax=Purpureocillium lilacinum TaxID=33203 RepID=A0A179GSC2_PURLI|nr:kinetochore protein fta7 [Purpureocillium lilacinum]